ncbi:MAG: hypothetical protein PHO41_07260 [Eubacteriales bacterium]|jgi:glycerate-2-kinase|nr:hypothetical protein [Eubacteriales bacterium]
MAREFKYDWSGDKVISLLEDSIAHALYLSAEALLTKANKLVPHDQGTLMRSGTVTADNLPDADDVFCPAYGTDGTDGQDMAGAFPDESSDEMYISYNTPYAVRLHEHPNYKFQDGRIGKWLETALDEFQDDFQGYMVKAIRKTLRKR